MHLAVGDEEGLESMAVMADSDALYDRQCDGDYGCEQIVDWNVAVSMLHFSAFYVASKWIVIYRSISIYSPTVLMEEWLPSRDRNFVVEWEWPPFWALSRDIHSDRLHILYRDRSLNSVMLHFHSINMVLLTTWWWWW